MASVDVSGSTRSSTSSRSSAGPSAGGRETIQPDENLHLKSRPSVRELMKELNTIAGNWERLLIHMGMKKYELDKIKVNRPEVDDQKMEAFDKWLRKNPDACWKNVIDALFDVEEATLASSLERKYSWKDPRVSVNFSFISASERARITAKPIDDITDIPCRRFLPPLNPGLEYFSLVDNHVQPMNERNAIKRAATYSRLLLTVPRPYSLAKFFESIEHSSSKGDFKVGLEARFGHVYWKVNPDKVLPPRSTRKDWSRVMRKHTFNTRVEDSDVDQLFAGRKMLGKGPITRMTLKFTVEGKNDGKYSAVIATYDDNEMFYLDAVYRQPGMENKARLTVAMPGRKYDFRIGECSECALLAEHKNSAPYQMAQDITNSLCRLPNGKIHLKLRGSLPESEWKVKYIRQRLQKQYEWKPERKWILATYEVDVFDSETNCTDVNTAPLNEGVDIEFDYSRKEVELWDQKIFPRNVSETHPSREKYYYMEGIEGVRLPGGELREPYDWTTDKILEHFDEFVGDVFKIAHILDGSPY